MRMNILQKNFIQGINYWESNSPRNRRAICILLVFILGYLLVFGIIFPEEQYKKNKYFQLQEDSRQLKILKAYDQRLRFSIADLKTAQNNVTVFKNSISRELKKKLNNYFPNHVPDLIGINISKDKKVAAKLHFNSISFALWIKQALPFFTQSGILLKKIKIEPSSIINTVNIDAELQLEVFDVLPMSLPLFNKK